MLGRSATCNVRGMTNEVYTLETALNRRRRYLEALDTVRGFGQVGESAAAAIADLVEDLCGMIAVPDTPCRFDHHGYCQEHLDFDIDENNPHCWAQLAEGLTT